MSDTQESRTLPEIALGQIHIQVFLRQILHGHHAGVTKKGIIFVRKARPFFQCPNIEARTEHITEGVREIIERRPGNIEMKLGCPEMRMV